jgi:FtsP/CotA-like multicopper oxidase with cupredoxin domain
VIDPGSARVYDYPNGQPGATLWYHDHSHHTEADHVYRGMHGFYLLEGEDEAQLGLPSGPYDVPILLRDVELDANGQLIVFDDPANRTTILANGKSQPYFPVAARKYRFRLLNGANERVFTLQLEGAPMVQIATDGGLLPAPVPRSELVLGSAERAEIVVDFAGCPLGSQVLLVDASGPVLRFDVTRTVADRSQVPATLRPLPALPPATTVRDVVLSFSLPPGELPVGLVNGQPYDPTRVDFLVNRGSTEIWRIYNADTDFGGFLHTFHLHLTQFRVLDIDGAPPPIDQLGLKDTVLVPPGKTVRLQATFADYLGKYAFHCHFNEHSSLGMMAQMEIVP